MAKLSGMTGFGRAQGSGDFGTVTVEVRSVNGKGLDIRMRLPNGMDSLEAPIRELIKSQLSRGSVQLGLSYEPVKANAGAQIDHDLLRAYGQAAKVLADEGLAGEASAGELLGLKGVVLSGDTNEAVELDELTPHILPIVSEALANLITSRQEEGRALEAMLNSHLAEIAELRDQAERSAETLPETIRNRIKSKFDELLPNGLDPERLEQEAAQLAVKADIREEIDRLKAHIDSAHDLIEAGSPCGRKLDFLSQEFNREANTLCSKSANPELTRLGLDMKAGVDRLREQVQNVE